MTAGLRHADPAAPSPGDGNGAAKCADPLTTGPAILGHGRATVARPCGLRRNRWSHGAGKFPTPLTTPGHRAAIVAAPQGSRRPLTVVPNRHNRVTRRRDRGRSNGAGKFPGPFTEDRREHGAAKFAGPLARARGWKICTPVSSGRRECQRGAPVEIRGGLTVAATCRHRGVLPVRG